MNPWLYAFLISLVILLILLDRKRLSANIYGGVIAASYKLVQNLLAKNWNYGNFMESTGICLHGVFF